MRAHVDFQSTWTRITLATSIKRADEWTITRMNKLMWVKMSFCNKALMTLVTCKWSGSRMSTKMCSQISTLCEEFITLKEWTLECTLTSFLPFKLDDLNYPFLTGLQLTYLEMWGRVCVVRFEGVILHFFFPGSQCVLKHFIISTIKRTHMSSSSTSSFISSGLIPSGLSFSSYKPCVWISVRFVTSLSVSVYRMSTM